MKPNRYQNATLDSYEIYDSKQEKVLERIKTEILANLTEHINKGTWFLFWGACGTGKTHLAHVILKQAEKVKVRHVILYAWRPKVEYKQAVCRYITAPELIEYSKIRIEDSTKIEELNNIKCCDFLILDELGIGYNTDHERIFLHTFLGFRYDNRLSTLLISNLGKRELQAYLTAPLWDRIKEAKWFAFTWGSYRGRRT